MTTPSQEIKEAAKEKECKDAGIVDELDKLLHNGQGVQAAEYVFNLLMNDYTFATMRDTGDIYVYNGSGIYRNDGEQVLHEVISQLYGQHSKINTYKELRHRIKGSTYLEREKFNAETNLIPVENGLVDIKSKTMMPHTPEKHFTFKIPVKFDAEATCPKIDKFFTEVFKPEDLPLAYEIIGYCLWREMPIHKAFMLLGEGKNGKTTYLNVIKAFIGEENISSRTLQDIVYNNFAASSLYGKLANISDDLPSTSLKTTGKFKMLTGGGVLSYEKKHKDASNFNNYAKLIFTANQLPASEDYTYAYFRRWCIIEFPNTFDGELCNTNLIKEITTPEELSGLLNKVLIYLEELLKRGAFSLGSTHDVEKEYIRRSDSITAFINECVIKDTTAPAIKRADFYEQYNAYCDEHDLVSKPQREFTTKIPVVAPWIVQCRMGNERGWKGAKVYTTQDICTRQDILDFNSHNKMLELDQKDGSLVKSENIDSSIDMSRTYRTSEISNIMHEGSMYNLIGDNTCTMSTEQICSSVYNFLPEEGIEYLDLAILLASLTDKQLRPALEELKTKGLIYEPKAGFWKKV